MEVQTARYLTFSVGPEWYGISMMRVKEISASVAVTGLPYQPAHVLGISRWRDRIIPVIDAGRRMEKQPVLVSRDNRLLLVEYTRGARHRCHEVMGCNRPACPGYNNIDKQCWSIPGTFCRGEIQGTYNEKIDACRLCKFYNSVYSNGEIAVAGVLVDSVGSIQNIALDQIEPCDLPGVKMDHTLISGIARMDDSVTILLNVDRMVMDTAPAPNRGPGGCLIGTADV